MATKAIAHTSSGVETVSILQPGQVDALATWLCEENLYHDRNYSGGLSDHGFNLEKRSNGGYCNCCRDFAGAILAHFDLREASDGK